MASPGAGQHFLPLENNGKAVDIDLINNIMREPYADRFRLIFNDLGAGFAARGEDLAAIIRRADPALRQTNLVLAELARQNQAAQPARARRRHDPGSRSPASAAATAGFINNANVAAEATAERSRDLEAGFQRFPEALRQLRLTMAKLRGFSDQATPVFAEFRDGGPAIARATRALGPFADATEPSLTSLGTAAEQSRQPLLDSVPTLRDARELAESAAPGAEAPREPARQPPADRLPRAAYEAALQHDGRDQRLRPVRPLPPRLAVAQPGLHVPGPDRELGCCNAHWGDRRAGKGERRAVEGPGAATIRALAKLAQADPAAYRKALENLQAQPPAQASSGAASRPPSLAAVRSLLDTMIGRQTPSNTGGGQ